MEYKWARRRADFLSGFSQRVEGGHVQIFLVPDDQSFVQFAGTDRGQIHVIRQTSHFGEDFGQM
jgi:hypothetical protein